MIKRLETTYKNESGKFLVDSIDFTKQYSYLYTCRMSQMFPLLQQVVKQRWGSQYPVKKLAKCDEQMLAQYQSVVLIGIVFKHQLHKPSILREVSEENQLAPQPPRERYADVGDKLLFEDDMQRAWLCGKIDIGLIATGVACAVLGSLEQCGLFAVEDIIFYEGGPQRVLPALTCRSRGLLVLLSGLNQLKTPSSADQADALNLFQHWLSGNISQQQPKQLSRLIVAGNSLLRSVVIKVSLLQTTKTQDDEYSDMMVVLNRLDKWFTAWARSIAVDVMPGAYDPSNFMLPQQPFHPLMFSASGQRRHFQSVPNPYSCTLDDLLVVGSSGQNVRDLLRSTTIDEELEALRSTLIWSHIAPTAPDTLASLPHVATDPLVLSECPHIYFAGNCQKFATDLHVGSSGQRTRLVCVPSFSTTQSVAVVDLDTLDCHQVSFAIQPIT